MGYRRLLQRHLIRLDGVAGLAAGVLVLLFRGWLADWYRLPRGLLLFLALVNLAYGACSFSLSLQASRRRPLVSALAVANLLWAACCLALAVGHWDGANPLGRAHLLGEGLFVGGLGWLEWRWRELLSGARHAGS